VRLESFGETRVASGNVFLQENAAIEELRVDRAEILNHTICRERKFNQLACRVFAKFTTKDASLYAGQLSFNSWQGEDAK